MKVGCQRMRVWGLRVVVVVEGQGKKNLCLAGMEHAAVDPARARPGAGKRTEPAGH